MQRYGLGRVVVWWILLGMALAAEQQPLAVPGAVREAPRVFVRYCSACHGVHGCGDGPAAAALQPPPADLTRIAQRHDGLFPVAEVTALIDGRTIIPAHGSREMPIWGERFGEGAPLNWRPSADAVAGEGGALSCAPSADAVAGNGRPLNWAPSADAVAGEMAGGGSAGEAVVHEVLRMLIDYLQAIQR